MSFTQFFVGSYNYSLWSQKADSPGISMCEIDTSTGTMQEIYSYGQLRNPSYLLVNNDILYAIEEIPEELEPRLCALKINDNSLEIFSSITLKGSSACHISINKQRTLIAVSYYASGGLELIALNKDGTIGERITKIQHEGHSLNPKRQEASHIHSSVFSDDGKYLFIADLGTDEIVIYKVPDNTPTQTLKLKAGSGPRHLAWHKNKKHLFLVNELSNTLSLCKFENFELKLIKTVSTLSTHSNFESYAATLKIHPNGKYIYVSNRGEDSIAVFKFNETTEALELIQSISSHGKFPRDLELSKDAGYLVVANQNSDDIFSYFINEKTGLLEPSNQELQLNTVVCVAL